MAKLSKKHSKNWANVQSMVDGTYGSEKIQVGMHIPDDVHANRKVGDKWIDADGDEWEQKEGYRSKVSKLASVGIFSKQCPDCKTNCSKEKRHLHTFNKFGKCWHCQINFEAELKSRPIRWFAWVRLQELNKMSTIDKEFEHMIFQMDDENKRLWDRSVVNALANHNVDTTMKVNKKLAN